MRFEIVKDQAASDVDDWISARQWRWPPSLIRSPCALSTLRFDVKIQYVRCADTRRRFRKCGQLSRVANYRHSVTHINAWHKSCSGMFMEERIDTCFKMAGDWAQSKISTGHKLLGRGIKAVSAIQVGPSSVTHLRADLQRHAAVATGFARPRVGEIVSRSGINDSGRRSCRPTVARNG
jgi:hypothetical protein